MKSDGVARQPWDRCPGCLSRAWKPYIRSTPMCGWFVWIRCQRCGNIGASVPMLRNDPREPQGLTRVYF